MGYLYLRAFWFNTNSPDLRIGNFRLTIRHCSKCNFPVVKDSRGLLIPGTISQIKCFTICAPWKSYISRSKTQFDKVCHLHGLYPILSHCAAVLFKTDLSQKGMVHSKNSNSSYKL